ncbi:MAG: TraR/DksA C4-type zinc finger protein [Planctomycetota bacterium]
MPKAKTDPMPSTPSSGIIIGGIEIVDRSKPLPKTKLRARELREFKELLLTKRRELLGDVNQLSSEALHTNRQESRGDLSNMPSHMADVGSDNWEQEFTLGLIETERALLRQIDAALLRIEDGTYGVCLATHRMISPERLRAKPWAQYCIEFARLCDAGRIPPGLV